MNSPAPIDPASLREREERHRVAAGSSLHATRKPWREKLNPLLGIGLSPRIVTAPVEAVVPTPALTGPYTGSQRASLRSLLRFLSAYLRIQKRP